MVIRLRRFRRKGRGTFDSSGYSVAVWNGGVGRHSPNTHLLQRRRFVVHSPPCLQPSLSLDPLQDQHAREQVGWHHVEGALCFEVIRECLCHVSVRIVPLGIVDQVVPPEQKARRYREATKEGLAPIGPQFFDQFVVHNMVVVIGIASGGLRRRGARRGALDPVDGGA